MIPPTEFLQTFIRPVLARLAKADARLGSRAAEVLLLGTALQESGLIHTVQIGGPALGFFQIEPTTGDDVYNRYLKQQRTDLLGAVNDFKHAGVSFEEQLRGNVMFGCALARIKYWMAPEPLPDAEDVDGMGQYWARIYNAGGKGTGPLWASKYRKYVKE